MYSKKPGNEFHTAVQPRSQGLSVCFEDPLKTKEKALEARLTAVSLVKMLTGISLSTMSILEVMIVLLRII